ncbi:MAG: PhzF family phenazine biosynthesis isomerase [Parcubacteria group bacterium]|jgi:PhzF family phenazine biosynthesis protein
MKSILVKAFTKDKAQGNPAGVIFDADKLLDNQMIEISKELGFSESAFIIKSDKAKFGIRYFSPTQEVDLCGHATVAAIYALFKERKIYLGSEKSKIIIETKAGIFPIEINKDGLIVMTQAEPQFWEDIHSKNEIANLLGISIEEIMDYPIQTVSTGTPKLMVGVNSLETLFKIKPDLEGIKAYCKEHLVKGFYPFTSETQEKDSDFHARQFNPLAGIDEDPITGVAAGALGAYIMKHKILDKKSFVIEQGYCMNKSGKMYVSIDDKVEVGGYAVIFGEKNL